MKMRPLILLKLKDERSILLEFNQEALTWRSPRIRKVTFYYSSQLKGYAVIVNDAGPRLTFGHAQISIDYKKLNVQENSSKTNK